MTYRGRVQGGVIVLDDIQAPPEGAAVEIRVTDRESPATRDQTIGELLLEFAGKAENLPPDASVNHDHYLYGLPKRE